MHQNFHLSVSCVFIIKRSFAGEIYEWERDSAEDVSKCRLFLRNVNLAHDVTLTTDFQYTSKHNGELFQRVYIQNAIFAGL